MTTIGIFEPDKNVRDVYEKFISSSHKDVEIFKFSTREEVLGFIKENSVQILIAEYVPDEKGVNCGNKFLQEVRRISSEMRIIICTNYLSEDKNSKNNIVLRKPVHRGDFISALKQTLSSI